MATKTDFTPEEWDSLRDAPHLIAAAMMLAGNSGITGTFKESFTIAQDFYKASASQNPLLHEIASQGELAAGQDFLRHQVTFGEVPQQAAARIHDLALGELDKALAALNAKGAAGDADEYRHWLLDIANSVANASKEGAFLGFGGQRISDGEENFLKQLDAKLQVH
jgi:hypothetical protein